MQSLRLTGAILSRRATKTNLSRSQLILELELLCMNLCKILRNRTLPSIKTGVTIIIIIARVVFAHPLRIVS